MSYAEIDDYLEGKLEGDALHAFEEKVKTDTSLQKQLDHERAMREHLSDQLLRERIRAARAGGDFPETNGKKRWLIGLLGLLLFSLVAFFFLKKDKPNSALPLEKNEAKTVVPLEDNASKPSEMPHIKPETEQKAEKPRPQAQMPKPNRPIAQATPLKPENLETKLRGGGAASSEWAVFVQSVWRTDFKAVSPQAKGQFPEIADLMSNGNYEDAFVELQLLDVEKKETDMAKLLTGICLLELHQGTEAMQYFDKIQDKKPYAMALEWYQVLAMLLRGEGTAAKSVAAGIAQQEGHPFRKEAIRVESIELKK